MATLKNSNAQQWLSEAQQGLDYSDPNAVSNLFNNLKSAGRPVEMAGDDLIKFIGDDAGTVDVLQNQAHVQGRGPVRGWSFQPFYGKDDFNRLRQEGRNPHTGEHMGPAAMGVSRDGGPRLGAMQPSPYFDNSVGQQAQEMLQPDAESQEEQDPWFVDILRRFQNNG